MASSTALSSSVHSMSDEVPAVYLGHTALPSDRPVASLAVELREVHSIFTASGCSAPGAVLCSRPRPTSFTLAGGFITASTTTADGMPSSIAFSCSQSNIELVESLRCNVYVVVKQNHSRTCHVFRCENHRLARRLAATLREWMSSSLNASTTSAATLTSSTASTHTVTVDPNEGTSDIDVEAGRSNSHTASSAAAHGDDKRAIGENEHHHHRPASFARLSRIGSFFRSHRHKHKGSSGMSHAQSSGSVRRNMRVAETAFGSGLPRTAWGNQGDMSSSASVPDLLDPEHPGLSTVRSFTSMGSLFRQSSVRSSVISHSSGDSGYEELDDKGLGMYDWYHGRINAYEAEHRMQFRPRGTFVVRSVLGGNYIVSMVGQYKRPKHFTITTTDGELHFKVPKESDAASLRFPSLPSLIKHFMETGAEVAGERLVEPAKPPRFFLRLQHGGMLRDESQLV